MNKPKARKNDIVVQKLEGETLVYDLKKNKAYCLNETSATVWELCNGNLDVSGISDEMSKTLKTLVSVDFVNLALDQLSNDGLLDNAERDYFAGLTRREVIRKVGFASVVALPIVSSLIAPEAIAAQSCLSGAGSGCGNPCCAGLTCFFGLHCCVPGVAAANSSGYHICQPIGSCTVPMTPQTECCSGTWSNDPLAGPPCPVGEERCRCDPMP